MAESTKTTPKAKQAVYASRLQARYVNDIAPKLVKDLGISRMEIPEIEKIVISIGLGKDKENKRMFEIANNTLTKITGQKPIETIAKQSIANFKLREGQRIGLKTTLRGEKMYDFFDRLVNLVLPRLRDFHGLPAKSFDATGNYSIGLKEQSVFHELSFEEISTAHGLEITIVTKTQNIEHNKVLLSEMGMPFEKEEQK